MSDMKILEKEYNIVLKSWNGVIKLAYDLNIAAVGIDVDKDLSTYSLKESFIIRETRMLSVIEKYKQKGLPCVVILGDTHLRTIKTDQLGDISPIWNKYKNDDTVKIWRTPYREIE